MPAPFFFLLAGIFLGIGLGVSCLILLLRWLAEPGSELAKTGAFKPYADF